MYIAFISSEENIRNLDKLKEINRQLALNPDLSDQDREKIFNDGKVFFLATLSMHSGEVAPSQSAPLIAYDLITTRDIEKLKWLDDVVYMMVPCHNPDGMDMIVENYRKNVDTKYEGSSMPGLYHKYVGHDNNRDFITLSQEDTKAIAKIYNTDWFPQVMVEKHQMGSGGVRYFVPPPHDPIAENIDAGIWNWIGIFGSNMMKDMTAAGLKGVAQHYLFDDYWPGSTETCIWKNVIGFLTEAASAKIASPVYIEENELNPGGKGLSEYKKSINMPDPWPGGWWRLSDIVEYEIVSTMSILKTASVNRQNILKFTNDLCRSEVAKGKNQPPYYYIMPAGQHDQGEMAGIVNLLLEHGVNVYTIINDLTVENMLVSKGSIIVPLAQPCRAFIKEVMEIQKYPVRHYTPDGEVIQPYDITSWSLPLHRGVKSMEVNTIISGLDGQLQPVSTPFRIGKEIPENYFGAVFPVTRNESYKAAFMAAGEGLNVSRFPNGDFLITSDKGKDSKLDAIIKTLNVLPQFTDQETDIALSAFKIPRIALVETNMHDIDAGWTRFILDTYHIPYKVIKPGDFELTDFTRSYDVILFPDNERSILMDGKYESDGKLYTTNYPPEFTKGIGKKGFAKLMAFVDQGGTILSWGESTALFIGPLSMKKGDTTEDFQFPVNDISKSLQKAGVACPGSLLKMNLVKDHPLTFGMEESVGVFFRGNPVFSTSLPSFDMDRRVIGKFPEEGILLSGYCEKPEKLADKTLMVWIKKGKGKLILYGFDPVFRASMQGTYKLLFNAILNPG